MRPAAIALALAAPVAAQDSIITSPIDGSTVSIPDVAADSVRAIAAQGATLKGLDKMSGQVADIPINTGETVAFGRIEISLGECRYPEDNPTGEAYAWMTIRDPRQDSILFDGWMVASSPALNALDHARYDVWVIRCTTA
ncbi:DUF2155 domain-containing protein [Silicimonas sp. MF1-12-2]|uniref:DUF2155 domain-containing protein n=1 Tax=Silicimonas sp. MF1-12-2 TaxID=3384793 RepID=UPI0039B54CFC